VSLAMRASKYNGGGGGARGDMRGYSFGPPAGTTTYGGSVMRVPGRGGQPGMGDPGLFDFFGGIVKKGLGVVSQLGIPLVSGAAGIASGFLGGGRGPGMSGGIGIQQSRFGRGQMAFQGTPTGVKERGILAAGQRFFPGGETGLGEGCTVGHRANKSGYWVYGRGGDPNNATYVAPETVCVKSRRMNPLNPRALSKAMRRIESAKRATTVLGRITIRKKC